MTTLILLRHGRSSANAAGVLAGRTPGVELDETGRSQAERVVERLAGVPLAEVVSSPALRCEQTVAPLLGERGLDRDDRAGAGRGRLRVVDRTVS